MSPHISPHDAHDDSRAGSRVGLRNGLHRDLVAKLSADGVLPEEWRSAFEAIVRHRFIPRVIWVGDDLQPLTRAEDPDAWMAAAYADAPVVTQIDDGIPGGGEAVRRYSTSSASMPTAVAAMLGHLNVRAGLRVLEIGTGTGYNAALLAHRLGDANVVTVEVDPGLAEMARTALAAAGHHPLVVTADGVAGWPDTAPYDRVIATAAVETVPYAWVEQTRPGGHVITPWGNSFYNGSLRRLDVDSGNDGNRRATATGRIVDNAAFMHLRNQRWLLLDPAPGQTRPGDVKETTTTGHPWYVTGEDGALLAIGHRVSGCIRFADPDADCEVTVWFADHDGVSWAYLRYVPDATTFQVRQAGPRHLWDEVEAAYDWWRAARSPGPDRYGVTVTPDGQTTWLDTPDNPIAA